MIIVHDIFICKPGNASKVAKMFKDMSDAMAESMGMGAGKGKGKAPTIMTDMTGQYNRVVMVAEYPSMAVYEESMKMYMDQSPKMKKALAKMAGYTDLYLTGSREIYKVW